MLKEPGLKMHYIVKYNNYFTHLCYADIYFIVITLYKIIFFYFIYSLIFKKIIMSAFQFKLPDQFDETKESKEFNARLNKITEETGMDAWDGNNMLITLFYIHLLHKYKMNCLLFSKQAFVGFDFELGIKDQEIIITGKGSPEMVKQLFKCIENGVPIIIIPLLISYVDDNGIINGHANMLIYRKKFNTIEHFEPHGNWFENNQALAEKINLEIQNQVVEPLNSLIQKKNSINFIKLISAEDSCPSIGLGFQTIEERNTEEKRKSHEKGYCAAWSLFFTELALCNPNIQSKDLINKMYDQFYDKETQTYDKKKMGNYFLDMIRGYTRMINRKIIRFLDVLFGKNYVTQQIYAGNFWLTLYDEIKLLLEVELELLNKPNITNKVFYTEIFNRMVDDGWKVKGNNGKIRDPNIDDLNYGTKWIHPEEGFDESDYIKWAKIAKNMEEARESPQSQEKELPITIFKVPSKIILGGKTKTGKLHKSSSRKIKNKITNRVKKVKSLFKRFFTKKMKVIR